MSEKRNISVSFNDDEKYIYEFFQKKGKISTEMKRVLKEHVDQAGNGARHEDMNEVLDERLGKILSIVLGGGVSHLGGSVSLTPDMLAQFANLQEKSVSHESQDNTIKDKEEDDDDDFDLPPQGIMNGFPMMSFDDDDDEDEE